IPEYRPDYPIQVKAVPGTDQLLVITQPRAYGPTKVERVIDPAANHGDKPRGSLTAVPVLTTPAGGTAYDLAFHPRFAENGFVYVGYNTRRAWCDPRKHCFVTRYTM